MADSTGRSRGRARGRARGQQQTQDQTRRPGQEEIVQQATQPGGNNGGGRRQHRGAPRVDPPNQPEPSVAIMQTQQLTQSMAAMGVQEPSGRGRSRILPSDERTRPASCENKQGSSGQAVKIVANFFEVLKKPQWAVYQYHVDFDPLVESSFLRKIFMRDHKERFGEAYLFDGMSDLKTIYKVDPSVELFSVRKTDGTKIRITLKFVAELAPSHPELQRLFNTQMRKNLTHLNYQLLGRYYFDKDAVSEIPQFNLQVWQGVITSIRQQEEKLMMCVDTTHKVIRKETAYKVIRQAVDDSSRSRTDYREIVSRELVGSIVMTKYNNRTYSVEDIDFNLNPTCTFERHKGGPTTYKDYFKTQYDVDITDMKQPLLLCKSKERELRGAKSDKKDCYLVPELCFMTGLTDSMRNDFNMMKELGNKTRLDPATRVRHLQTFISRVNQNDNVRREMGAWGIEFSKNLVSFDGRILPPEKIRQGQICGPYDQSRGDFSREVRGNRMHTAFNIDDWAIIYTQRDTGLAQDFLNNLYKVCTPMGMKVNKPRELAVRDDRVATYLQACRDMVSDRTAMVCFIVPNNKKERYDALKKHCCLDFPIPSQVIVSRTLSKKQMLMSVATKIGIQLNCKLGGEPWAIDVPIQKKLMIVGYDTYHDSSRKGQSVGAFVASLNSTFTRWYSKVAFHSKGGWNEISNHMERHLTDALRKFQEINKTGPDMILFYRDGVGDGQIRTVMDMEVKACRKKIKESLRDKDTKFAFIVVNKKINPRFFAQTKPGQFQNPPPGTIVDHTVTRFDRYDFFLVSQSVRQGTVGPTMYNVIDDDTGLKPEHIQRLSYKLTHLYFNFQGTIRVPAPCQYAHKLAFLVGQSLHQEPKDELCDKLFYL